MDEHLPQIIRQWLGSQRDAAHEHFDATTRDAAHICAASQSASGAAGEPEPLNRKERARYNASVRPLEEAALQTWAQNSGLWISEDDFTQHYGARYIGAGAEQSVYLHPNGVDVIKTNTGTYHGAWLEFFNRLLCHALLFPTTAYSTVGFTSVGETFAVVIRQQFALLSEGAPRSIVEPYLVHHGFNRTKNDDYYNPALGIILEDLHDENVFLLAGKLLFIDPVIYFETSDMALDKNVVFRFPF